MIFIAVIVITIVVIVFYPSKKEDEMIINSGGIGVVLTEDSGTADIKTIPIGDGTIDDNGIININPIEKQKLDIPNLNRKIVFSDSMPEDARKIILSNIATLITQLKEDSSSFKNWLDLATHYKIIEDYEGARDIWEFINETSPRNSVSFSNLGDLYHYNLKDFSKSEKNFKEAIERNLSVQSYIGLHELYKYSYKQDTTLAVDILVEGMLKNPTSIDLIITLANYYKERGNIAKGDFTNAKKYYEQARDNAKKMANTQLVELLDLEIANL